MIEGIDVSHYQRNVDWRAVADDGILFAFAKASEGIALHDPLFARNWSQMQNAGLVRGAYHFFRPRQDAAQQAANFLKVVSLEANDLPAVLDIEVNDGVADSAIIAGITTWLEMVEQATGKRPIIYTAAGFWNATMNSAFGAYPLWVANYTSAAVPKMPKGWKAWTFWQYTQAGRAHGVAGSVDRNRFNGDLEALHAFVAGSNVAGTTTSGTIDGGTLPQ